MGEELLGTLLTTENDDLVSGIIKDYLDRRCLIINQLIDDELFEYFSLQILKWNLEDSGKPIEKRKKIYIFINCDGGEVVPGLHMLDAITCSATPVVTIGFSRCSSMASYILVAGKERYCFPHTVILYHDGQTGYVTSANKGKDVQRFYDSLADRMTDFMIKHTQMDADFLEKIKDREYYMWGQEAKERGLIDKIIGEDCTLDEIFED